MVEGATLLNDKSEKLTAQELTDMIGLSKVKAIGFFNHTKATERYVILSVDDAGTTKEWYLPYYYRRTNVRIDTTSDLVDYVGKSVPMLTAKRVATYKAEIQKILKKLFGKKSSVTLPIFKKLLDNCGEWVWNKKFVSSNPQRRIQDLKEMGFTLATKMEDKKTYHMLMPFDMVTAPTYETIPPKNQKGHFCGIRRN